MSSEREKEIKHLIYLKSKLIQQTKKEIKQLQRERETIGKRKVRTVTKWEKGE